MPEPGPPPLSLIHIYVDLVGEGLLDILLAEDLQLEQRQGRARDVYKRQGRVGVPRSPLIQPLFKRSRIMVRHIVWWTDRKSTRLNSVTQ